MNATMVASGTKAVPSVVSSIQDIPLVKIRESKTNPRTFLMKQSSRNSPTTSNNTAYSNRFSCVRFPMGKRARMNLWPERAATVPQSSQNAKPSRRLCTEKKRARLLIPRGRNASGTIKSLCVSAVTHGNGR